MAPQPLPPNLQPGTVVGGRYEVVRVLGAGAMGVVLAVKTEDGRLLALKVLQQSAKDFGGPEGLLRFLREAQVASSINSPHVVPVIDGGIDETLGAPFLVMILMTGVDLGACLGKAGCLHPTVAVRIAMQAARGLKAAHAANVIHRDVKPSNLFLSHGAAGDVTVKVCDFGIAKAVTSAEGITSTGSTLGTPLYMAPEQLMDAKHVDARADVWGLAMTLYEALSGQPAHARSRSLPELAVALMNSDTPSLQDLAPWVDPGLATVIHGALLRDLPTRCPSMTAFADALVPFMGGTDRLHAEMLQSLPDDFRTLRAPRAELPKHWVGAMPSVPPPAVKWSRAEESESPSAPSNLPSSESALAFAETVAAPSGVDASPARGLSLEPSSAQSPQIRPSESTSRLTVVVAAAATVLLGVAVGIGVWLASR